MTHCGIGTPCRAGCDRCHITAADAPAARRAASPHVQAQHAGFRVEPAADSRRRPMPATADTRRIRHRRCARRRWHAPCCRRADRARNFLAPSGDPEGQSRPAPLILINEETSQH